MSRNAQIAALALLIVTLAPAAALAGGNANFTIGFRDLGSDWSPLDSQLMLGATVDWGMDDWPVHLAWGLNASADSQENIYGYGPWKTSAAYAELSFGALWLPIRDKAVRPYLGAGIASVAVAYEEEAFGRTVDDDDQDFTYYANAGIYWRLGPRFNLGHRPPLRRGDGVRRLRLVEVGEDSIKKDGGYFAYSLLLGFGWGK